MRAGTVLVALAAGLAFGCASSLPVAGVADASRTGHRADELNEGRTLYLTRCARCHEAYAPSTRTAAEWTTEVDEMSERAGLDDAESIRVARYLTAFAAGESDAVGVSIAPHAETAASQDSSSHTQ